MRLRRMDTGLVLHETMNGFLSRKGDILRLGVSMDIPHLSGRIG